MSPFAEASAVSVDGFGDFCSAAWGFGAGSRLAIDGRVHFPHSLGIFYQAVTQYLGFWSYGDEYKVMGLAPYGRPRFADALRNFVTLEADGGFALDLAYFRHHREGIDFQWHGGVPTFGRMFSDALPTLLGPARASGEPLDDRHCDVACSAQVVYEEAFFNLLARLHERHGGTDIAVAGGCGMNSVANGKIRRRTPYRRVYVQPAAGDAGGAVGAAFAVWHEVLGQSPRFLMDHAYWGPAFSADAVDALVDNCRDRLQERGCAVARLDEDALCRRTAERSPMVRWSAGSRGGWSGDRGRWAIVRSSAIRAAPT